MARHCSERERNAEAAEKESLTIKRLQYFEDQVESGNREPYRAVITKVTSRGLVVELVDSLQNGFIPYAAFTGEYIKVDVDQGKAYNQATKAQYQMGDFLDVGITSIDSGKRQAEFYPCSSGESPSPTRKQSTGKKRSSHRPKKEKSVTPKRKGPRKGKKKKRNP